MQKERGRSCQNTYGTKNILENGMAYGPKQDVGVYRAFRIYFWIRVEKNSELAEALRKFKSCVVFQGNQLSDDN